MFVIANLIRENSSFEIVDTSILEKEIKKEVQSVAKGIIVKNFSNDDWNLIQKGVVTDEDIFPVRIHGIINISED